VYFYRNKACRFDDPLTDSKLQPTYVVFDLSTYYIKVSVEFEASSTFALQNINIAGRVNTCTPVVFSFLADVVL